MELSDATEYVNQLTEHYELYFGVEGSRLILNEGPMEKLHNSFFILGFPPSERHNMFAYCTVGMSLARNDNVLTELVVYSPIASKSLIVLLTACASHHRNVLPVTIDHTVNIGQPWLDQSKCDHGFISLPYLDGPELELFNFGEQEIHCYWFIPITEKERDYKIANGAEALEQLFENKQLDYLNPNRKCLVG